MVYVIGFLYILMKFKDFNFGIVVSDFFCLFYCSCKYLFDLVVGKIGMISFFIVLVFLFIFFFLLSVCDWLMCFIFVDGFWVVWDVCW